MKEMTPEIFRLALGKTMSREAWLTWLRALAMQDLPLARRAALVNVIWLESHLLARGLLWRVRDLLSIRCFGATPDETFTQDIAAVHEAFAAARHQMKRDEQGGYYVVGRPRVNAEWRQLVTAGKADVDPQQIAASRHLTIAQKFQQGCSMTNLAYRVTAYRLRQRQPQLSEAEALRIVRMRSG